MKKFLFIFSFFFLPTANCLLPTAVCFSQNLVPNPSFEDTFYCPVAGEIDAVQNWKTYSATPDYYNACDTPPNFSVPSNSGGYQNAATGNAYCGLYTYSSININYREHIGVQLLNAITIGQKYYISIKVSLSDNSPCATNNIGVLLTTASHIDQNPFDFNWGWLTNNLTHINALNIINDKINWTIISGTVIADSAYQYIAVGNFFNDSITTRIPSNCSGYAYYYIDEICVSADSLTCDLVSDVKDQYLEKIINIYPNPANSKVNIRTSFKIRADIKIYNVIGVLIEEFYQTDNEFEIDVSHLTYGTYLLKFLYHDSVITKKLTITN